MYVGRAICSVVHQDYQDFEIIIVNDGSTDGSEAIAEKYCSSKVKIINQPNQGVSVARNRGVLEAKNEYICFLDADDEWDTTFLSRMHHLIRSYPEALLYCLGHRVSENGNVATPVHGCSEGFIGYVEDFFSASSLGSVANSSKVCVSKRALIEIGGFPSGVRAGEDLYVWIKLSLSGKVACHNMISVTVHRCGDHGQVSRVGEIPYPLVYFKGHLEEIEKVPSVISYLAKIGTNHVIGARLAGNWPAFFKRLKYLAFYSWFWAMVCFITALLPISLLNAVRGIIVGLKKS